ncbi:MAG TPA: hemolysin family protein [Pyrinomonadaceae bacterium]|nr:hemolysin family protein [Pyrinomonadaceae bacterium]
MELEIASLVIILLILIFLATIDTAFARLSDVSLRRLAGDAEEANNNTSAELLREILENRPQFRFVLSSAIQILLIGFTVVLTLLVKLIITTDTQLLIGTLALALLSTVLFRQIFPRLFVRNNTDQKLLFLLPVIRPLYSVAKTVGVPFAPFPPVKEKHRLDITVAPDARDEADNDTADDFQALMEVGEAEGIIEESEREMIETMVELSETRAGEIMTPRTEICALPITSTIRDARNLIIDQKYSRLPVYHESVDNIEGILYVRDLLAAWSEGNDSRPVSEIMRGPFFVPETKTASDLLKSMQQNHVQIAIVIDEYGGVAGVVTVEDILEEIVGEIEDEDIEEEEIIEIIEGEDGYWDVLGSTEIEKIERLFDIEIEDEDFTTIAGMVTSESGYVPKVGEKLKIRGLDIEVLRGDEKKLALLRIRRAEPETAQDETNS